MSILIPIRDLGDKELRLKKEISYLMELNNSEVTGYYKPLDIYAFSDNIADITKEISDEILDLYDDLVNARRKLGDIPRRWKKHLKEIIEPVNQ